MKNRKNKKRNNYKFSNKKNPLSSIISVVIAFVVLAGFFVLCIQSALSGGNGDISYAVVGIGMFLLSMVGLVLAVLSFRKPDIRYGFPIVGMVMNGILFILYLMVYIVGAVA